MILSLTWMLCQVCIGQRWASYSRTKKRMMGISQILSDWPSLSLSGGEAKVKTDSVETTKGWLRPQCLGDVAVSCVPMHLWIKDKNTYFPFDFFSYQRERMGNRKYLFNWSVRINEFVVQLEQFSPRIKSDNSRQRPLKSPVLIQF